LFSEEQKKERILKIHPGKERQNLEKWDEKKGEKKAYLLRKNKYLYIFLYSYLLFLFYF